jgi:hypothetical protein
MKLDTMAKKATALTAIGSLIGMTFYASTVMWTAAHSYYAQAADVDYLYQKQIEGDIWRYEDELEELEEHEKVLIENDPDSSAVVKIHRRIEKLVNRIERLNIKLEGGE